MRVLNPFVAGVVFAAVAATTVVPLGQAVWAADPPPSAAAPAKPPQEDPEVRMGREAHEELLKSGIKFIKDPKVTDRVERIGKKIAEIANKTPVTATFGSAQVVPYDYKFFVIDDKDVNAFSLPGGFIYFNTGLLNYVQSDDELAGVMAHEITHASHHHVAKLQREANKLNTQAMLAAVAAILTRSPDLANLASGVQFLGVQKINGHSQNAERDADNGAVILAKAAGFNPVGALTVMERFARDEKMRPETEMGIYRTHPPSRERADAMIAEIKGMGLPINRREVTNAIRATVRATEVDEEKVSEVVLDGKVLFRTPSADRAKQAAAVVNRLLDADLQIYDVKKDGSRLVARGETILTAEPGDAAVVETLPNAPATTSAAPEAVVDQAFKVLRFALYKQSLDMVF